jgi:hypothetical protein
MGVKSSNDEIVLTRLLRYNACHPEEEQMCLEDNAKLRGDLKRAHTKRNKAQKKNPAEFAKAQADVDHLTKLRDEICGSLNDSEKISQAET